MMRTTNQLGRRRFLGVLAGVLWLAVPACTKRQKPVPARPPVPPPAPAAAPTLGNEELALVEQLLKILLPSALTAPEIAAEAKALRDWLSGYDAAAQATHHHIRPTRPVDSFLVPPSPLEDYRKQLAGIAARRKAGETLEAIVTSTLARSPASAIPTVMYATAERRAADAKAAEPANEREIVLDLLAFYYRKPASLDLLYQRKIGARTRRSLATAGDEPEPL